MPEFSKETLNFLTNVGEEKRSRILQPTVPSADRMTPGEILIFRYDVQTPVYRGMRGRFSSNQKVVLIVRCKRGNGVFPGKTVPLVSCFKLHGNSESVVEIIVDNLYKKRRKASYYGKIKDSLVSLLGIQSYRTYKLPEMTSLWKVNLGKA